MTRALIATLIALFAPDLATAQGINTSVALPVAQGEGIWRPQVRFLRATDDPTAMDRELETLATPQTLVYGVTPHLAVFGTLPLLARRELKGGPEARRDRAVGDVRFLARYTAFADDYAPLSTRRAALLLGVKLPTGADRFGTPTFDPIIGAVATWAANRHELDLDALLTVGTRRQGFESPHRLRYDLAYRYRLWPARFGRRLIQLNGLVELNGHRCGRVRDHGARVRDSGGQALFFSPGVQLATLNWIAELSVQLPVTQRLRGDQIEADFVVVLSIRIPFSLE